MTKQGTYVDGGACDGDTIRQAACYPSPSRQLRSNPTRKLRQTGRLGGIAAVSGDLFSSGLSDVTRSFQLRSDAGTPVQSAMAAKT